MIQVKVNYLVDGTFWCFSWRKSISKLLGEYIYHSFKITKDVNLASTLLNSIMKNVSVVISQEEVVIIDYFIDVK